MKYQIFKMHFNTPVHFGTGRLSQSDNVIYADTLFSALFIETMKLYGLDTAEELVKCAREGSLLLSDTMPYIDESLYIPKPIITIDNTENSGSSVVKKDFKKLKYLPISSINEYLSGNYNPRPTIDRLKLLGSYNLNAKVAVIPDEDSKPYNVRTFTFGDDCGLYFICVGEDAVIKLIIDAMNSLSFVGLGGERSSGYGKFDFEHFEAPDYLISMFVDNFTDYVSLSLSISSNQEELDKALDGASYELVKRSGFVGSYDYSDTFLKKRELVCFKSGSSFKNKFKGDVVDVSVNGNHPVYRYAMPLFLGFNRR